MDELESPLRASVCSFDEIDRVGRLRLQSGEELRFGASACQGFAATVGMTVYVTVVGPHPLGGRKAIRVRPSEANEATVRAREAERAVEDAARLSAEAARKRELLLPLLTPETIAQRVRDAVPAGENEADHWRMRELVDELRLVGPSLAHVRPVLDGIATSMPLTYFGNPGPLVHYVESFHPQGYAETLFEVAPTAPTRHFAVMLCRLANGGDEWSARALELLRAYAADATVPIDLRQEAAELVEARSGS